MYMRVTHGQWADPATPSNEAARQMLDELFALVTVMPGNRSYMGAVDPGSGRTLAISTWDAEEHAQSLAGTAEIVSRQHRPL